MVLFGIVQFVHQLSPKKRRAEIKKAIDAHTGGLYMLTLTIPHYMGDCLKSLLLGFRGALKRFFNGTQKQSDLGGYGQDRAYQGTRSNSWAQRLAPSLPYFDIYTSRIATRL